MNVLAKYCFPLLLLVLVYLLKDYANVLAPLLTAFYFIYYLNLDQTNKNYLNQFGVAVALLPISSLLVSSGYLSGNIGMTLIYIVGVISFVMYFLRYRSKTNSGTPIELLKLAGVIQLIALYFVDHMNLAWIAALIVGVIYFITRISIIRGAIK